MKNNKIKNIIFSSIVVLLIIILAIVIINNISKDKDEKNMDVVSDEVEDEIEILTDESGSYIYFGIYPQREVVSKISDSGVYEKVWESNDDYIIDENLYNTLNNLSDEEWNNNDTVVDNNKYRRIKASDTTYNTYLDDNYYDWKSTDNYHYFKYEPIKWIVLEQSDSDIFVLSSLALDDQKYNTNITNITWEFSTIRSWLNGYDSNSNSYGTDYSSNNFINTAFTSSEQSKIKLTTIVNNDNSKNGTDGGNDTSDMIYLLSVDEVSGEDAVKYGFNADYNNHDIIRQVKSSTYAKAMGVYVETESDYIGNSFWWLRTPGSYTGLFTLIRCNGSVYRGGQHANSKSRAVRPAMHLIY